MNSDERGWQKAVCIVDGVVHAVAVRQVHGYLHGCDIQAEDRDG